MAGIPEEHHPWFHDVVDVGFESIVSSITLNIVIQDGEQ
jgi:hypothetical protein